MASAGLLHFCSVAEAEMRAAQIRPYKIPTALVERYDQILGAMQERAPRRVDTKVAPAAVPGAQER